MSKLGLVASASILFGALTFASFSSSSPTVASADAPLPCQHKVHKTEMMVEACKKDQKAAKDAMKAFMKKAGIKSCNACHSKLAPSYDNKPDAYEQFVKAGGKLIDAGKAAPPKPPAKTAPTPTKPPATK